MAKPATASATDAVTAEQPPAEIPDTLFVQDTTCVPGFEPDGKTQLSRSHVQIVDEIEQPFIFFHGKKTEMPSGIAMKFLKIPEFVVTDHKGKRVARTPDQPDEHSRKPFVLRDDQVVADLSELTDESLWKRCQQTKGGERIAKDSGRGIMIAHLVETRKTEQALRKGPGDPGLSKAAVGAGGAADAPAED